MDDPEALNYRYTFYDPVYTLPEEGQAFWRGEEQRGIRSK
jgi:lysine 2,3-aminomutase